MEARPVTRVPTDSERVFLDEARTQLAANHERIRHHLRQLDDQQVVRTAVGPVSVAGLVLRLCRDLDHKIVSVVGGLSARWDRPGGPPGRGVVSRDELLARLDAAVGRADAVLAVITPDRLREARRYPGPDRVVEGTVLTVIFGTLMELAGHTREVVGVPGPVYEPGRAGPLARDDPVGVADPRHQGEPVLCPRDAEGDVDRALVFDIWRRSDERRKLGDAVDLGAEAG
jgi:hypothetical protein